MHRGRRVVNASHGSDGRGPRRSQAAKERERVRSGCERSGSPSVGIRGAAARRGSRVGTRRFVRELRRRARGRFVRRFSRARFLQPASTARWAIRFGIKAVSARVSGNSASMAGLEPARSSADVARSPTPRSIGRTRIRNARFFVGPQTRAVRVGPDSDAVQWRRGCRARSILPRF